MSSRPTHRLYFASKNKEGARVYYDLCALWLAREKPSAEIAGPYKDRPGISKIVMSNGKTIDVSDFWLNVKVSDDARHGGAQSKSKDFAAGEDFPADDFTNNHDDIPF